MKVNKKSVMYMFAGLSAVLMVSGFALAALVDAETGMYTFVTGLAAGTLVLFMADKKPAK